jgi:hypothetical protein
MAYALVEDIPASWEQYEPVDAAIADPVPQGLILHVAGPTDDGVRTIEVWESRDAWRRFRDGRPAAQTGSPPTLRELHALHFVRGAAREVA